MVSITQTARLILRERVDFARQQPDRNRQSRAATVDSCFVLIGTRQHGVAVLYETSDRASSNKMQQNPCPIKFRTLNLPAPRITRCHITCLRAKADKASNSCLAKSTECPGGGGGYLGSVLLGMCRWPLRASAPV